MAKPRVFVSSSFYDLRYMRAAIEALIEGIGFEPILSEKGLVTYLPDIPLDESCYKDIASSDLFVLIVGGRYGSSSTRSQKEGKDPGYESITRAEYRTAVEKDIPIYVLVDGTVYGEYKMFLNNADNHEIQYAHVDDKNVFAFLKEILHQPRNNPVCQFTSFGDIESFLKQQWAGLFQRLLQERSERKQITTLAAQVAELGEFNKTIKVYMEALLSQLRPRESAKLIKREDARMREVEVYTDFVANTYWSDIATETRKTMEELFDAVKEAKDIQELVRRVWSDVKTMGGPDAKSLKEQFAVQTNRIRAALGCSLIA